VIKPYPTLSYERLLTPQEMADAFGVGTVTLMKWAREGKIRQIVTPGGISRYYASDIPQVSGEPAP
jgi:predicted site-specific integrase-resolvase